MITLVSSMSREEGGKLQHCISAKEMWQTLENHYEGNIQVKSKKVQLHMYEYELFKMKPQETITEMTNRLTALITTLKKLGKHFTKEAVNNKILRILPKKDWESRVTSIEEAQDLATLQTNVLIGKLLTHELTIKQRGEELQEKEEKKKSISLKASQNESEEENNKGASEEDDDVALITKQFKKFLRKQQTSRTRDFNKTYEGEGKRRIKEVTCYECKKPGRIRSECPKLKIKSKGTKEKRKAFKATWDDSSESEKEEEQQEVANLCFMALEDKNEVPSVFNPSCDENDNDDDDDDECSFASKLLQKYTCLLSRKKFYKNKFTSLTKEFENLKNEFSNLVISNDKLVCDLKNSNSLEDQLKKAKDENQKLSKEVLELKNSISKFERGKGTLENILDSQKIHRDISGLGYENGMTSSSSYINFVSQNSTASTSNNETQAFKVKRAQVSNKRRRSQKSQPPLTQRGKAQTRAPPQKHAYMYTRHNTPKHATQHNAHKHVA